MAMVFKDLCRLCAKKDEFTKDLLDENSKSILKLIQDFIQIIVQENDNLPTKICLNCEEKMVSFQLFVLECYKAQESLRKLYLESFNALQVKLERVVLGNSEIKSEVKDEMTAEEILNSALHNESKEQGDCHSVQDDEDQDDDNDDDRDGAYIYDDDDYDEDDADDEDFMDNMTIASLKGIKDHIKLKELNKEDTQDLSQILKRPNLKVKDLIKFECYICYEDLKSWSSLSFHYEEVHKSQPHVVCLCGFIIRSKSVLYKHMSEHKAESRKLRNISNSNEEAEVEKYARLNVKDFVSFICSVCDKKCSSWYSLKSHCERLHKILPVVNCVCGITLKSKSVMYKHVQDHKNPNVLACDKCPKITKTIAALNKHKIRHIPKNDRKFCCSSCDKIFQTKDGLKSHMRSHIPIEDRKIYHCEICNVKFTTRSSAAAHKRVVHDKIKGYICDLCGYACGTNGELRQHRAIHSDAKPFVCKKCPKSFKTYSNLKTHMDTHEDTSYECYICRRVLNSRRTLRKHLLVHEEKCRHVCSYCNKAFKRRQTLKVHMYTHTGDKPLTCRWCDERFAYASTLRSHRLRCHSDKMAAQAHGNYPTYSHAAMHQDYIKNDMGPVNRSVAKNEVEAM